MATQLTRAPATAAISVPSNNVAVQAIFGQKTQRITMQCDQPFRFDFVGPEGGLLGATTSAGPIDANSFFEVGVDMGPGGSVFVLVPTGAPATLLIISEPL